MEDVLPGVPLLPINVTHDLSPVSSFANALILPAYNLARSPADLAFLSSACMRHAGKARILEIRGTFSSMDGERELVLTCRAPAGPLFADGKMGERVEDVGMLGRDTSEATEWAVTVSVVSRLLDGVGLGSSTGTAGLTSESIIPAAVLAPTAAAAAVLALLRSAMNAAALTFASPRLLTRGTTSAAGAGDT
jgi:hypothetical protein